MKTASNKSIRFLTVAFGGLPILLWLPIMALWIVAAGSEVHVAVYGRVEGLFALLLVAWGTLGLWGAYALWAAAIGPLPVRKPTALGLVAGIAAMIVLLVFVTLNSIMTKGQLRVPDPFALWLTMGPLVVAVWHVNQFIRKA